MEPAVEWVWESEEDRQLEAEGKVKARKEGSAFCKQFDAEKILNSLVCEYYDSASDDLLCDLRDLFWGTEIQDRKVTGKLRKYLKK